jgi:hypothetical protein
VAGLDAARGFAMVLVFASHFADAYLGSAGAHRTHEAVVRASFAASPMFMLVSGLLLGFLFASHRDGFDRLRKKLVDRALFLLTAAHFAIVAAHAVLPWMALYLAATVLGERLARLQIVARGLHVATLAGLGALLASVGTFLRGLRPLLALVVPGGTGESSPVRVLTGTGRKLPLGPAYLFFYAGIALLLLAGCLWLSEVRPAAAVLEALQALGRNSFFVFVLQ